MTKQVKILSYRYDKKLNRSIPDKCKVIEDQQGLFSLAEVLDIIKAAYLINNK